MPFSTYYLFWSSFIYVLTFFTYLPLSTYLPFWPTYLFLTYLPFSTYLPFLPTYPCQKLTFLTYSPLSTYLTVFDLLASFDLLTFINSFNLNNHLSWALFPLTRWTSLDCSSALWLVKSYISLEPSIDLFSVHNEDYLRSGMVPLRTFFRFHSNLKQSLDYLWLFLYSGWNCLVPAQTKHRLVTPTPRLIPIAHSCIFHSLFLYLRFI